MSKENEFWNWFIKNEQTIYKNIDDLNEREKLFDTINSRLSVIDKNLTFEFGLENDNGIREFTISADGIKESFPSVEKLFESAPSLSNWQFYAFRQRVADDNLTVKYGDYEISYENIYFRYSTANNEFGVELNIQNYDGTGSMQNAIYILLDGLLGEYDVTMHLDWIEWVKLDENDVDDLFKFIELKDLMNQNKLKIS